METIVIEVKERRELWRCRSEHAIYAPLKAWLLSLGINLPSDRSLGASSTETFIIYKRTGDFLRQKKRLFLNL